MTAQTEPQPVKKWDWINTLDSLDVSSSVAAVGTKLALHANSDGTSAHPGIPRLARETKLSERTVWAALTTLRDELGLLHRVYRGSSAGRRRMADEYHLVIPVDLLDRCNTLPMVVR